MKHSLMFSGCVVIITIILLWKFLRRKYVSVDKYEYIELMSFEEWKPGLRIRKEMEAKKSGLIDAGTFYIRMMELEEEGLIERRMIEDEPSQIVLCNFRKKKGGRRKRKEEINSLHLPALQHA